MAQLCSESCSKPYKYEWCMGEKVHAYKMHTNSCTQIYPELFLWVSGVGYHGPRVHGAGETSIWRLFQTPREAAPRHIENLTSHFFGCQAFSVSETMLFMENSPEDQQIHLMKYSFYLLFLKHNTATVKLDTFPGIQSSSTEIVRNNGTKYLLCDSKANF